MCTCLRWRRYAGPPHPRMLSAWRIEQGKSQELDRMSRQNDARCFCCLPQSEVRCCFAPCHKGIWYNLFHNPRVHFESLGRPWEILWINFVPWAPLMGALGTHFGQWELLGWSLGRLGPFDVASLEKQHWTWNLAPFPPTLPSPPFWGLAESVLLRSHDRWSDKFCFLLRSHDRCSNSLRYIQISQNDFEYPRFLWVLYCIFKFLEYVQEGRAV